MPTVEEILVFAAIAVLAFFIVWRRVRSPRRVVRYVPVGLFSRRYVIWFPIPRRRKLPVPVVLAFHGGGATVERFEADAALHGVPAATGFAIVYPEGYHRSWNAGGCCGDAMRSNIDDVRFVRAIIDDLATILTIDRRRIYATGFSNGAMLCYRLACTIAEEVAAIAPVAGGMSILECRPARAVPIFHLHGLADEQVPYESGTRAEPAALPPIGQGIAVWRRINRAGAESATRLFGSADCTVYPAGPDGAEIRVCVIPGLGHCWPGSTTTAKDHTEGAQSEPLVAPLDSRQVNTAILDFFAAHSLPEPRLRRIRLDSKAPPGAAADLEPPRT